MSSWEARYLSILRIMTGLLFMEHGLSKLIGFPTPSPAHPSTFPGGPAFFWLAAVLECFGGALVAVGLFTRWVAFVLSGEMAIGYFMVHNPKSFFPLINQGDAAILYCLIFFYFFVAGGGAWSLDRFFATPSAESVRVEA